MALRSLGSSLAARSATGGKLREVDEANFAQSSIPGKASIGSVERASLEEPLQRAVPPGSSKSVNVAPGIENAVAPLGGDVATPTATPMGATAGIGLGVGSNGGVVPPVAPMIPTLDAVAPQGVPPGGNNQALFQGTPSTPATPPPQPAAAAPRGQVLGASTVRAPSFSAPRGRNAPQTKLGNRQIVQLRSKPGGSALRSSGMA